MEYGSKKSGNDNILNRDFYYTYVECGKYPRFTIMTYLFLCVSNQGKKLLLPIETFISMKGCENYIGIVYQ